jgi:glycosyltransferase involved in cell wall biosynthesis
MPEVLSSASLVVLPSYYGEGLPKVLIEASACGRAVITTDHPGCRDAIIPDVTGLLVPVKNSNALANAMQYLLSNPGLCQSMGGKGRLLAESKFDVVHVVAKHMRIYHELTQAI